ncbi:hypothetical protein GCM10027040_12900 [Halomonas shantousis]
MSVPMISDPVQYAPVNRRYRRVVAGALALGLHAGLIAWMATWDILPAGSTPAATQSLDVVLVSEPAPLPVEAGSIGEADQRASGEQREQPTAVQAPAEDAADTGPSGPSQPAAATDASEPSSAESTSSDAARRTVSAAAVSAGRQAAEPVQRTTPESPAPLREAPPSAEPAAEPEPADEPATAPEPDEPAPAATPQTSSSSASRSRPSGAELLARATSSVREQAFTASRTSDEPPRSAARQAAEARYIADWTRRVEQYGNLHYPAPSHLEGQLRIRVVIGRQGQVREAEVVHSSGYPELDQAALDTVRGAAPYRPFDAGLEGRDSLEITRIWRFGKGNNFGVH